MPVGTQATVKGLTPDQLRATGSRDAPGQHVSPGAAARRGGGRGAGGPASVHGLGRADPDRLGGVPGLQPGGPRRSSRKQGVTFRSHLDGRLLELTPERAVAIQEALGADVAMCLDHCPALARLEGDDRRGRRPDGPLGRAVQGRSHPGATRPSSGSSRGGATPTSAASAPRR